MKTKYIIILAVVVIMIIAFIIIIISNKNKTISNLKGLSFHYTTGYMINAYVRYDIKYEQNKFIATIKPSGVPEEESIAKEINKNTISKIENILNKYEVEKWNGFNKHDKNVLDGNSFSIHISMKDNKTITAQGYMKWPKHYAEVKNELDSVFSKIYNDNK